MKTTKRKIISFFVLLFLWFTIVLPVYADTAWDTDDTSTNTNSGSISETNNDWIKALAPQNKGEVTIGSDTKKVKVVRDYNLSQKDKQILINKNQYMLPTWMNNNSCNNTNSDVESVFFWKNNASCQKFLIEWEWMNEFSKSFFSDVIDNAKKELLDTDKTEDTLSGSSDWSNMDVQSNIEDQGKESQDWVSWKWEETTKTTEDWTNKDDTSSGASGTDEISAIFSWLNLGLDDVNGSIEWSWAQLNDNTSISLDLSDWVESENNSWKDITEEWENKTSTGIVIWDISSWDKLNTSVDRVLEKFLDPDKYVQVEKNIKEKQEKTIEKDSVKKVESERVVDLNELFPHIYINSDINTFTQKLFWPDVIDIMYGAQIDNDSLSGISANYLAISLEKFRAQKEILEIGWNQIFWLKWYEYYNKSVTELFEKFLERNPSVSEQKQLAKDLSAISFSFSTYSNLTINFKTKDVFKNKLILDFQKLEKDYKSISKQNIIRNFLLRR